MNQGLQYVFLIVVYFLASIVATLTISYFISIRPKNLVINDETKQGKTGFLKIGRSDTSKISTLFGISRFFQTKRTIGPPTKLPEKEISKNRPDLKKETVPERQPKNNQGIQKENLKKNPRKDKRTSSKVESSSKNLQTQNKPKISGSSTAIATPIPPDEGERTNFHQEPVKELNQATNTSEKVPISQSESAPSTDLAQEKPVNKENSTPTAPGGVPQGKSGSPELSDAEKQTVQEAGNSDPPKIVKPETEINTSTPSLKIVNEKAGTIEMENKPKEVKPSDDFSDLFTQDNDEENEVGRLAKELDDLDTQSILDDSLDLINQFKRNTN
jgi:hypothetical protein